MCNSFLGNTETGVMEGNYTVTFSLLTSRDQPLNEAIWNESHTIYITQGKVSEVLGQKRPLNYHLFKGDDVFLSLSFQEIDDTVTVPLISVPGAVVAKYSDYARELEYTESWMKVNTVNHRVGIGITQNLTVPFQVVGSANITSVNATGELHSPDGYNVHQLDYLKLVNLDDYSLSPYDAPSRTDNNAPTRDVVFVTTVGNVGVNIDVTANIQEPLHVSGNLKVDHAAIKGNSNIELVGTSLASTGTYNSEKQLIWNSQKGFFRAGESSSSKWSSENSGNYSVAFGKGNEVSGDYGSAAGGDNTVSRPYSVVAGGLENTVAVKESGVLSGKSNNVNTAVNGGTVIAGGNNNETRSDYVFIGAGQNNQILATSDHASILGGKNNVIHAGSNYSAILGGNGHEIYGQYSYVLGQNSRVGNSNSSTDGVFIFADTSSTDEFRNNKANQFLIRAKNGVMVGLNDVNMNVPRFIKDDEENRKFPPENAPQVEDHTIWSAGDIVAAKITDSGQLEFNYLVGDGRFITNISSLWQGDSTNQSVYVENKRVGIGGNNDADPKDSSLFIKQTVDHPAIIKIQSNAVDPSALLIGFNDQNKALIQNNSNSSMLFKYKANTVAEMTANDNGEFYIHSNVGVGVENPDDKLDVEGSAQITGKLNVAEIEASATITANAFVGDGSQLTDVPVWYMTPSDGTPARQLVLNNDGLVGIGAVTSNIQASLHIGESNSNIPQLRLEDTTASNRYTTMTSSNHFNLTFHNVAISDTKIIDFVREKDDSSSQLLSIRANGNVGIGKDPATAFKLDVNGNVNATKFFGNGSELSDVQLNAIQNNAVTFNATVELNDVLKLNPSNSDPCDADSAGSLYTKNEMLNGTNVIALCFCTGNNSRAAISPAGATCEF